MIKGKRYHDHAPEGIEIEPGGIGTLRDDGWAWFDVADTTVVDLSRLQEALGLHPLAVEHARHRQRRPTGAGTGVASPIAAGMTAVASTALNVVSKRRDWF